MMTSPGLATGANMALLAPTTIRASPRLTRIHSVNLREGVSPECNTAAEAPNLRVIASST